MSSRSVDFVTGLSPVARKKKSKEFNLCYAYPRIEHNVNIDSIIRNNHVNPQNPGNDEELINDGLHASPEGPLKSSIVKPYSLVRLRKVIVESSTEPRTKLLEIAVRDVKIHQSFNGSQSPIEITSVSIMFNGKVICKSSSPFDRKLHKLLLSDSSETNDLSVRVQSRDANCAILPLPLPRFSVNDKRVEIDFSIRDTIGRIHSGTVFFTVTLTTRDTESLDEPSAHVLSVSNDSCNPQNSLTSLHCPKKPERNDQVRYFRLHDPALCLDIIPDEAASTRSKKEETPKPPNIVVSEQPSLSIVGLSLGKWFQARRPLRPSSGTNTHKLRTGREEIVTITILRGVEVPVREESALVQPLIEIHWGTDTRSTSAADGPAPIWQETVEFEVSRHSNEQFVKLSLYDQHPIWGLQWLGDATIPLEFHRNYQEFERWIGLSPLFSPVVRFGYVQASPVRSYTRIYILMKMERPGNIVKSSEISSSDLLAKSIQRCMMAPYKIPGTESAEDCATLVMLLNPLPSHYGPLTPRQALKLNKIDDYGRAALLATLLQGLGLDAYVLIENVCMASAIWKLHDLTNLLSLGSSQARKWAAFVVSFDENGTSPCLWDPENGDHYDFGDSRCSLIKASRMINHHNIWKNMQKSTTVPFNLRLNPKSNKDWQALPNAGASTAGTLSTSREVQILELADVIQEDDELHLEIERNLREKLSQWRSNIALTTMFNRHAVTILRSYLEKFNSRTDSQPDKKELRQLYRAYHIHGFILNLRRDTPNVLADQLFATKIHAITGPVEFALVSRVQKHIARTCSIWLAVVVLRNRD